MMYSIRVLAFLLIIHFSSFSQRDLSSFDLNGEKLIQKNVLNKYLNFDFSKTWYTKKNRSVIGIIGKNHQRIKIKILSVKKDKKNFKRYFVKGKSKVRKTICDFEGEIILSVIKEYKEMHYGVDNYFKSKGITSQGIVIADYIFKENGKQKHSGFFKGKLYSKFLKYDDFVEYDDVESDHDGYINNAFVGVWKSYKTKKEKLCNWGDYRVLFANEDFDIGAAEFSPSKKYLKYGWLNYSKAWFNNDEKARIEEQKKWWE